MPASKYAELDAVTRIATTKARIVPYVPDLDLDIVMFAHTTTFLGGAIHIDVNTSDPSFQISQDPTTNETVGEYEISLEVPVNESLYCFNITVLQACDGAKSPVSGPHFINGALFPQPPASPAPPGGTPPGAPIALGDSYTTPENIALIVAAPGVLTNDSTSSGTMIANLVTGPLNGALQLNRDGSFTYTPNNGFYGTDGFTYVANNGADSNVAQVVIAVTALNLPVGPSRYWIAASQGNWDDSNNWSTVSAGAGGASAPDMGNVAYFDQGGSGQCLLDVSVQLQGINIAQGFQGSITQLADAALTVGYGKYQQAGGSFQGNNGAITFNDDFLLTGGAFPGTSGTMTFTKNLSVGQAVFSASRGTTAFTGVSIVDIPKIVDFYNLTVNCPDWGSVTITPGNTAVVNGKLICANGRADGGTFLSRGDMSIFSGWGGGNTNLTFIGQSNQNIAGPGTYSGLVNVKKPAGTVLSAGSAGLGLYGGLVLNSGAFQSSSGTLQFMGQLSQFNGTFDPAGGTFEIDGPSLIAGRQQLSFKNLTVKANDPDLVNVTTASGETLLVNGTLNLISGTLNSATPVEPYGDTCVWPSFRAMNAVLQIGGPGAQKLWANGGIGDLFGDLIVSKTDGVFTIADTIQLHSNLLLEGGDINPGSSTIVFTGPNDSIIGSGIQVNNLVVNKTMLDQYMGAQVKVATDVTVLGNLQLTSGDLSLPGDGNFFVGGNIDFAPGQWKFESNSSELVLNGTSAQQINFGNQFVHDLTIANTSAPVTFVSGATVERLFTASPGVHLNFKNTGTFNFNDVSMAGTVAAPIVLRSTVDNQPWNLNVLQYPFTAYHVDVRDCNSIGSPANAIGSVDSGDNRNWQMLGNTLLAITTPEQSLTNPAWFEGTCRADVNSIVVTTNAGSAPATRLSSTGWFGANNTGSLGIAISPTAPTNVSVAASAPGSAQPSQATQNIVWTPLDVKGKNSSSDAVTIRQNDALLLTCSGPRAVLTIDADGDGVVDFTGIPGNNFSIHLCGAWRVHRTRKDRQC